MGGRTGPDEPGRQGGVNHARNNSRYPWEVATATGRDVPKSSRINSPGPANALVCRHLRSRPAAAPRFYHRRCNNRTGRRRTRCDRADWQSRPSDSRSSSPMSGARYRPPRRPNMSQRLRIRRRKTRQRGTARRARYRRAGFNNWADDASPECGSSRAYRRSRRPDARS